MKGPNLPTALKRSKKGEEGEEEGPRQQSDGDMATSIMNFVDGVPMTVLMTLLTIFTLFGVDIQNWAFDKRADLTFEILLVFAMFMFFLEFVLTTLAKPGFKYSFFFWLDLIAALSIAPDVSFIESAFTSAFTISDAGSEGASVDFGEARTARVVRLVRLIRLIRIVKLYSMVSKVDDAKEEEKLKAQARLAQNAKQAALKRVEASRLGRVLSEQTTRQVICGVLLMLFAMPFLTYEHTDRSKLWGLTQLFWYGRSNCSFANHSGYADVNGQTHPMMYCDKQLEAGASPSTSAWVTREGWKNVVYLYSQVSQSELDPSDQETEPPKPLLWLHVPDFLGTGVIRQLDSVETEFGSWQQDSRCAGVVVPDECPYRASTELLEVTYTPFECAETQDCDKVKATARFNIAATGQEDAKMNLLKTIVVCILLGTMSNLFQSDTQELVIAPIEKMVNIIKQLAEDPLRKTEIGKPALVNKEDNKRRKKKANGPQLETSILENTILKIGGLLQVGFGEAGAEIIGKNMSGGDGELNIMMPGTRIQAVFGFCDIKRFAELTEVLDLEILMFANTIGKLVHSCVHRWSGVANKNLGDAFLVLWKMPEEAPGGTATDGKMSLASQKTEIADRSLIAFVKVLAELRRSEEVLKYVHDSRIGEKFELFQVELGLSLHVGWAIEGPIGSDFKIDPAYLSPHVNVTIQLELVSRRYDLPLLFSESLYNLLSLRAKDRVRKLDVVSIDGQKHGLFTFPMAKDYVVHQPSTHTLGDVIKPEALDEVPLEAIESEGAEYLYVVDQDIVQWQEGLNHTLANRFREGLCHYIDGDWTEAKTALESALQADPDDGPTQAILAFMGMTGFVAPEEWAGCRPLILPASSP